MTPAKSFIVPAHNSAVSGAISGFLCMALVSLPIIRICKAKTLISLKQINKLALLSS